MLAKISSRDIKLGQSDRLLEPGGPTSLKKNGFKPIIDETSEHTGSVLLFELAYHRAYQDAEAVARGGSEPVGHSERARVMADTGFHLVDDYCAEYFRNGGEEQKWLLVSRDVTIAAGTLATGILALTSSAGNGAAAVALGTVVLTNNLDIFSRNFLFGADNIKSVQDLVQLALKEDRFQLPIAKGESANWTFQSASPVILQHQTICQQANILKLVRDAVAHGKVKPEPLEFDKRNAVADNTGKKPVAPDGGAKTPPEKRPAGKTTMSSTDNLDSVPEEPKPSPTPNSTDNPAMMQRRIGVW